MLDLQGIFDLILMFAGVDIVGQLNAFADSFGYSLLLWILNLGGLI